jgi:hypothetical protein
MLVPDFKSKLWLRSFSRPTQPWPSMGRKEPRRGWFPFPYPPVTGLAHPELMNDVAGGHVSLTGEPVVARWPTRIIGNCSIASFTRLRS